MEYSIYKSLHLIFMVSWFAGLFYIVRLFIYHVEAETDNKEGKEFLIPQYMLMQKRLWWIITTPAMFLTVVFGGLMLFKNPGLFKMPWMQIKLVLVVLLIIYHFYCQKILLKLQKNKIVLRSQMLRIWNEVATLFLVAIIFIVVLKSSLNWLYATITFLVVAVILMVAINLYKKYRKE